MSLRRDGPSRQANSQTGFGLWRKLRPHSVKTTWKEDDWNCGQLHLSKCCFLVEASKTFKVTCSNYSRHLELRKTALLSYSNLILTINSYEKKKLMLSNIWFKCFLVSLVRVSSNSRNLSKFPWLLYKFIEILNPYLTFSHSGLNVLKFDIKKLCTLCYIVCLWRVRVL